LECPFGIFRLGCVEEWVGKPHSELLTRRFCFGWVVITLSNGMGYGW